MAKKLKVEVEAETAKARSKIRRDLGGVIDGSPGSGSGAPPVMDGTSRALKSLGDSARVADSAAKSLAPALKSFAGIAAGMATSYAANYMDPGVARTSLGYLGSMAAYGSTGFMLGRNFGPQGAAIGTGVGMAVGAGKQYLDNDSAEKDWWKSFNKSESATQSAAEWARVFKELTKIDDDFGKLKGVKLFEAQIAALDKTAKATATALENLKTGENQTLVRINDIKTGKTSLKTADEKLEELDNLKENLATYRSKRAQLESFIEARDNQRHQLELKIKNFEEQPAPRANESALDALTRLGATFGGGDYSREQLALQQETNTILARIEQKTGVSSSAFDK